MLVVFCKNISEIVLSFMAGGLKLAFFVGQILNSMIIFILRQREYKGHGPLQFIVPGSCEITQFALYACGNSSEL